MFDVVIGGVISKPPFLDDTRTLHLVSDHNLTLFILYSNLTFYIYLQTFCNEARFGFDP